MLKLKINKVVADEIKASVHNDMVSKYHKSLSEAPLNNTNFKLMPKVKLKNPSKAGRLLMMQKMEASELKSSIARYLLAHISKNLNKKSKKLPFDKIIKLPQMLGYGEIDAQISFKTQNII